MTTTRPNPETGVPSAKTIDTISGLITGAFCAGLFNPWDRAIYLSMSNKRRFLDWNNFKFPYQGSSQSILQKTIFFGVYLAVQGQMQTNIYPTVRQELKYSESSAQMLIGLAAGGCEGILKSPTSAIKAYTWGNKTGSFFESGRQMFASGGMKPFLKGTPATLGRDITFGITYEVARHFLNEHTNSTNRNVAEAQNNKPNFACNTISAAIATVISSPFNYARTMQYATRPNQTPPSIFSCLRTVWIDSKKPGQLPLLGRANNIANQFKLATGTLRLACGMGIGQRFFDGTKKQLTENEQYIRKTFGLK